jgi:hypothetical protein
MQGAVRTGPERTGSYVRTGSAAATQQMAFHGQALSNHPPARVVDKNAPATRHGAPAIPRRPHV